MKLPQHIEGIHREGRTDSLAYVDGPGVEPQFLGGLWDKVKKYGKKLLPKAGCAACNLIPNAALKAACQAVACR